MVGDGAMPCTMGGLSPGPGLDKKGPTAVLKSCGKINHISDGRAFLLNQRVVADAASGREGVSAMEVLHEDVG